MARESIDIREQLTKFDVAASLRAVAEERVQTTRERMLMPAWQQLIGILGEVVQQQARHRHEIIKSALEMKADSRRQHYEAAQTKGGWTYYAPSAMRRAERESQEEFACVMEWVEEVDAEQNAQIAGLAHAILHFIDPKAGSDTTTKIDGVVRKLAAGLAGDEYELDDEGGFDPDLEYED